MFRTLTTIGVLLLVGKSFLIDKGVPVDGIVEHGGQTINAPFDWDRYDAASAALIAFMGWNVWRKRPKWARFLSKRKARKQDKREIERMDLMRSPLTAYQDNVREQLYKIRADVEKAMRDGRSRLILRAPDIGESVPARLVTRLSEMLAQEWPGIMVHNGSCGTTQIDWSECRGAQEELRDLKTAAMQAQYGSVPPTSIAPSPQPPF